MRERKQEGRGGWEGGKVEWIEDERGGSKGGGGNRRRGKEAEKGKERGRKESEKRGRREGERGKENRMKEKKSVRKGRMNPYGNTDASSDLSLHKITYLLLGNSP